MADGPLQEDMRFGKAFGDQALYAKRQRLLCVKASPSPALQRLLCAPRRAIPPVAVFMGLFCLYPIG